MEKRIKRHCIRTYLTRLARDHSGISLIELVVSVVMMSVVIISLSAFVPSASKSVVRSRKHVVAKNLAMAKLEELQKSSYAVVPLTPAPTGSPNYFPISGINNSVASGACDCSKDAESIGLIPASATTLDNQPIADQVTENGIVYRRAVCISQLQGSNGGIWKSTCGGVANWQETGMKLAHVRVTWTSLDGKAAHIDAEAVLAKQ
jgi:Tfp pilus assembly protein PilV